MQRDAVLKKNITGVFFRYVTPGVIGMVGLSLYILADTYFIANGIGRLGLASLNIGLPVYNLIFGIGALLGIGGGTVFSILHGRAEHERANRPFTIAAVLGVCFSLLFALLGAFASGPIAALLGATEETASYTVTYLRVILLFSPAFILNNIMTAFVRNDGNPHLAMAAMTISTLTNIVLDYVFIYPLRLGMFGAALATGLGTVLGLLIHLTHFLRKSNTLRLLRMRPAFREILQIFTGILFPTQIAGLFNQEKSPELTALAVRAIHRYFLAFALMGFNIITITSLAAMSQLKEAFVLSVLRGVAVILPVLLLLSHFFGLDGVWLTIPVTELLIALLGTVFLLRVHRKLKKV